MSKGKRKKKSLLIKCLIPGLCLATLIGFFFLLFYVKPTQTAFRYELGENVSHELKDYISGLDWAVNLSSLDLSEVDQSQVGSYRAGLKHGPFQKFTYKIDIVDTTPPKISVISKTLPIQRLEEYDYKSFVTAYSDNSSQVDFSFATDKNEQVDLLYSQSVIKGTTRGESKVEIIAVDPSGNETRKEVSVFVDDPPVIEGVSDLYVAKGSEVNWLKNVSAYDETDGEVSLIDYEIKGDYENEPGDYVISYFAKDSFGFETSEEATVHICEPLVLQEMVNRHEIDGLSDYVTGLINPYDMGISVGNDVEEALNLAVASLVHIRTDYPGGGYVHGSGFIIDITDDEVIICTNKHVVEERLSMDVYFESGVKAKGKVVASISVPDIAFMSVKKSDIPVYELKRIKTIHLNTPYFNGLSDKPDVDIMIRSNYKDGSAWRIGKGKIVRKSGVLSQYFAGFDYPVTQIDLTLIGGMSGSPVVDETGSLICMATYKWFNGSDDECYGVKVTDIVAYYKEVFGRDADYYIAYQ